MMPKPITVTKVDTDNQATEEQHNDERFPRWVRLSGLGMAAAAPIVGESLAYTGTGWAPLAALPVTAAGLQVVKHAGDLGVAFADQLHRAKFPAKLQDWLIPHLPENAAPESILRAGRVINGGLLLAALDGAASGLWGSPAMAAWLAWSAYTTRTIWRATGARPAPAVVPVNSLAAEWAEYVASTGGAMPGSVLADAVTVPHEQGGGWEGVAVGRRGKKAVVEFEDLVSALDLEHDGMLTLERINARRLKVRVMQHDPLQNAPNFGDVMSEVDANGFIRIGTYRDGTPALLRILVPRKSALHLFLIGATGSGKGGLADVILSQLRMSGIAAWYLDGKGGQSAPHWIGKVDRYTSTDAEHAAAFADLKRLVEARKAASKTLKWTDKKGRTHEGRKFFVHGDPWPMVYVLIDEANVMLQNPEYAEVVRIIATQGRSLGIGLVVMGQSPNLEDLGGGAIVRDSLRAGGSLVLLRTADPNMARTALGSLADGADVLTIPQTFPDGSPAFGLGYVFTHGSKPGQFRTLNLPDDPDTCPVDVMDIFDVLDALELTCPLVSVRSEIPEAPADEKAATPPAKTPATVGLDALPEVQAAAAEPKGSRAVAEKFLTDRAALGNLAFSTAEFRMACDLTGSQASPLLTRMKNDGLVVSTGRGTWAVAVKTTDREPVAA